MIYSVKLHLVVLYNIGDHLSRKIPSLVGVLLGHTNDGTAIVSQLFEVPETDGIIDDNFLSKRVAQYKTVLPGIEIVGVYTIDSKRPSVMDQFNHFPQELVYTVFSLVDDIVLYCHDEETKTIIVSSESERIATETIHLNRDYSLVDSGQVPEVLLTTHQANLMLLVTLIYDQLVKILGWLALNDVDVAKRVMINNKVVFLSNKLAAIERSPKPDNTIISCATQLALLTEELAAMQRLEALVSRNMIRVAVGYSGMQPKAFGAKD